MHKADRESDIAIPLWVVTDIKKRFNEEAFTQASALSKNVHSRERHFCDRELSVGSDTLKEEFRFEEVHFGQRNFRSV